MGMAQEVVVLHLQKEISHLILVSRIARVDETLHEDRLPTPELHQQQSGLYFTRKRFVRCLELRILLSQLDKRYPFGRMHLCNGGSIGVTNEIAKIEDYMDSTTGPPQDSSGPQSFGGLPILSVITVLSV